MRKLIFIVPFWGVFSSMAQVVPQIWLSGIVNKELKNNFSTSASLDVRFYELNLPGTLFPQLSLNYKIRDGIKVSADYRTIFSANEFSNYSFDNRLNFNLELKYKMKQMDVGLRTRYQSTFGSRALTSYSTEFDQALRFKPAIALHFSKKITPNFYSEWFYSLANKELGKRFTKVRYAAGISFNLKGPRTLDVKYIYGKSINLPKYAREHILSLTYTYDWPKKAKNKD